MAIFAKGIGICDTNIQSGYNLTNVDLTLVWNGGGQTASSSNDSTWLVPEGKSACTITASKSHYAQSGTYYGRLGYAYTCPECGGEVTTIDSECPVCGEPVVSSSALTPVLAVSGGTNDGWKTGSQGGKILLTRTNDNKAMTQGQLKDTLSGMGFTSAYINSPTKITSNTSAFKTNVSNNLTNYPVTIYEGTYADNKAYLHKNSFIPQTVPFSEPYYIRVVSGKTQNIDSSAQIINFVIRTNIPSPYNFVSASSVNWITRIHYLEDLHYPDFSLIKLIANVSENDSLTDARSGVITISDSTYGVSGAITVNQSAMTISEFNIDFEKIIDNPYDVSFSQADYMAFANSSGDILDTAVPMSQVMDINGNVSMTVPISAVTGETVYLDFHLDNSLVNPSYHFEARSSLGGSTLSIYSDQPEGMLGLDTEDLKAEADESGYIKITIYLKTL